MKFFLRALVAAGLLGFSTVKAAEPPKETAAEVKALAAEINAKTNAEERDALLARAPADSLENQSLARELIRLAQQRTLAGDYVGAEALLRFVLGFAEKRHDAEVIASAEMMLASPLREFGELDEALALDQRALKYYEDNPSNARSFSSALLSTAIIRLYRSEFSEALRLLDRALSLARRIDYKEGIIPVLNTTGEVYRAQGQPERALHFYEKARALVGDDRAWNMAFLFNNIGQCYEAMGRFEEAIDYIQRAKEVAEQVKFRPRVATSLAVLGNLQLHKGDRDAAERCYRESLALSRELREQASEARALLGLAEVARARGEAEAGLEAASQAAAIEREIGRHSELAAAQTTVGRCQLALGRRDEARAALLEAIAATERVRRQVAGDAVESEAFFANKVAPYHEMVALLASDGESGAALQMAERASARALLDILASGRPDLERSGNDAERARLHELSRRLAELNHELKEARGATIPDEREVARLQAAVTEAREARESFETSLAVHQATGRTRSAAEVATPDEIANLVRDREMALLKFVVNERETLLFVLHGQPEKEALTEVFRLNLGRADITERVEDFRAKLATRALDWQKPARDLYQILLGNSEASWKDARRVVIVPDGPLWELPFQALQAGKTSLIEGRAISYAPSISFLARAHVGASDASLRHARLLALGNPSLGNSDGEFDESWTPLPAAAKQVAEIGDIFGAEQSRTLIGDAAREEVVVRDAGEFDVLHFATHGILNNTAPLYSYLLLAQENLAPGEDGLLEGWELMRMKLNARLAVLAACETARGQVSEGEGVIGLSWALFVAGCPSTVVSQWKVDSASSTPLMLEFYRRLHEGASVTAALRQASLALMKDPQYRHPFYWAPFVLIGTG